MDEREELEIEHSARFDYDRERAAADLLPCRCGRMVVDPVEHCPPYGAGDEEYEGARDAALGDYSLLPPGHPALGGAVGDNDDIPF